MDRTILHSDCNSFYASVESARNPKLKEIPMAVGGDTQSRHGIILAKNELAKKCGVKTAQTIWQAKEKCPSLTVVPPHHELYKQYSDMVFSIYRRYTDLVESFGLDEAWLDVTASRRLFGDGKEIADTLRETVKKETGLTVSVGVSFCKVFAKLGSDYKKPDATTVFDRSCWREKIYPMDIRALLYVGKSTYKELYKLGITTIGTLACADKKLLSTKLGKAGVMLWEHANGMDNSPVASVYDEKEIKSVGNGCTFAEDLVGEESVRRGIYFLSDSIAARMRAKGVKCSTVQVKIKSPDFKVVQRQKALDHPTYLAHEIRMAAMEIIHDCWRMTSPIRMLTVTGSSLVRQERVTEQLSLFDDSLSRDKAERLERTMDSLRSKYGKTIFDSYFSVDS